MNLTSLALLSGTIGKEIYKSGGDNEINRALSDIIKIVGGVGGSILTLVVMVIAIVIMTGSVAPRNVGKVWGALFSVIGGALVFYSAFLFSDFLSGIIG